MRQCRGKRIKDGRWVKGCHCQIGVDHYINDCPRESGWGGLPFIHYEIDGWVRVDPATVGESTGLTDKSGVDLDWWEGDAFRCTSVSDYPLFIVFEDGSYWFKISTGNVRYRCFDVTECWHPLPVKIGNKWDNPELLEKDNGNIN